MKVMQTYVVEALEGGEHDGDVGLTGELHAVEQQAVIGGFKIV